MLSPKKYTDNIINNNRIINTGDKEVEISNVTMNLTTSDIPQLQIDSSSTAADHAINSSLHDNHPVNTGSSETSTESYIQVVVQKQPKLHKFENNSKKNPPQTSRVPKASSPIKLQKIGDAEAGNAEAGNGMYVIPPSFILLPQQPYWKYGHNFVETATSARNSASFKKLVQAIRYENKVNNNNNIKVDEIEINKQQQVNNKCEKSKWKCFEEKDSNLNNPQRIEVYYFDRGCADYLSTADCSSIPITEKLVGRGTHIIDRILSELCAVPHLFIAVPLKLIVHSQKMILITLRNIIMESTQTYSDYFLKPVLAVSYNAIIQPPLVFATNIGVGVKNVLKPLWEIFGDMVEPIKKLAGSLHLVHVEKKCKSCEQRV